VKFYFASILQKFRQVAPQELQDALYFFICYVDKCTQSADPMLNYELCNQFNEVALWAAADLVEVR
jgi:hypothetical protein